MVMMTATWPITTPLENSKVTPRLGDNTEDAEKKKGWREVLMMTIENARDADEKYPLSSRQQSGESYIQGEASGRFCRRQ